MAERDPYAVLGVAPHADADAIAAAYREQARRHHPDVSAEPDAERRMAEINAAWATLRDPVRRAALDRSQGRRGAVPGAAGAAVPPAGRATGGATTAPGTGSSTRPPAGTGVRPPMGGPGSAGSGAPPEWRRGPAGEGAAGPPPGPRRGSVLPFGRHIGWSIGEIARVDPGYLAWLKDRREGAPYRAEIEQVLGAMARPEPAAAARKAQRRGPFRR